jgi:hypothetical protein
LLRNRGKEETNQPFSNLLAFSHGYKAYIKVKRVYKK